MKSLNFNHLKYFYEAAKSGGVTKAAEKLFVSPQTVSAQISLLEESIGLLLFERQGKRLKLNPEGELVLRYAEDIFQSGRELVAQLGAGHIHAMTLNVGIIDAIPKILSFDILSPAYKLDNIKIITHETDFEDLLAELALNRLDVVFSDRPVTPGLGIKAHSREVLKSGMSFVCAPSLFKNLDDTFPQNLHQQPLLIPGERCMVYNALNSWFDRMQLRPVVIGEFDDTALMKFFGQAGHGIFCIPTLIEKFVIKQFGVCLVGRTSEVVETLYAITPSRKIAHQAVELIIDSVQNIP